jgi:hypothetical protein
MHGKTAFTKLRTGAARANLPFVLPNTTPHRRENMAPKKKTATKKTAAKKPAAKKGAKKAKK